MIDNFTPQPYPLEHSDDGETWHLVLGWIDLGSGAILPVLAPGQVGHYRLAELPGRRVVQAFTSPSPRPVAAPARSTTSSA